MKFGLVFRARLQGLARVLTRLSLMGLFGLLVACSGKVELLSSLPEADANEVIAALLNNGISASKVAGKEGMVGIEIEGARAAQAVDVLRALGLPRERFSGMGQVFKKDGLISSPVEERARYLYALSQDLSATLSRIDGVLFARVHLVLPERGSGSDPNTPSSAAVFIKHRADANVEIFQPQVRRLVANSIPGLASERVSLVFVPSSVSSPLGLSAASNWTSVFGFRVDASSARLLGGLLIALLVFALAAVGAAAYLWMKLRGANRTNVSQ
jgi:type III secretion protein J